jgi:hypothetical protein
MSKPLAELRVIAKYGDEYASTVYVTQGIRGDIYCGYRIRWAENLGVKELFRSSYHRDGSLWHRIGQGPVKKEMLACPRDLQGILHLGSRSPNLSDAQFLSQPPKLDTQTRRSLVVDLLDIFPEGFTVEIFACQSGQTDLFSEETSRKQERFRVLGSVMADWSTPNLGIFAWTLPREQWGNLDRAIEEEAS